MDVTEATFEQEVIARSREIPVVVDFWADWCGPCRVLGPVLERLEAESGGRWVLAKVDVTANPGLANRYGVQGIPAVKAFRGGEVVAEFVGAMPEAAVRRWLGGFDPDEADDLVARGDAARADGRNDDAVAAYRAALEVRADHPDALLGLAELASDPGEARDLLGRLPPRLSPEQAARRARIALGLDGNGGDVASLRARVEAAPDDLDARWELAHALAAAERYDEALGHLLEIVRRDRSYRDDGARKAMLEIFDVVGPRSELADGWRSKLAMVLYA